jgi:hypothetical protein
MVHCYNWLLTTPSPSCSDLLVVESEWSLYKHLLRWMCHDPNTATSSASASAPASSDRASATAVSLRNSGSTGRIVDEEAAAAVQGAVGVTVAAGMGNAAAGAAAVARSSASVSNSQTTVSGAATAAASTTSSTSGSNSSSPTIAIAGSLSEIESNYGESIASSTTGAKAASTVNPPSAGKAAALAGNSDSPGGDGVASGDRGGGKGTGSKEGTGSKAGGSNASAGPSGNGGSSSPNASSGGRGSLSNSGGSTDQVEINDTDGMPAGLAKAVRGRSLLNKVRWPLLGKERLSKWVWRSLVLENFWDEVAQLVEEAIILQVASASSEVNCNSLCNAEVFNRCTVLTPAHFRRRCRPTQEEGSAS